MHPSNSTPSHPSIHKDEERYDRLRKVAMEHGVNAALLILLLPAAIAMPVFYLMGLAYAIESAMGPAVAVYASFAAFLFPVVVITLIVQQWRLRRELLVEAHAEWARVLKGRESKLDQPTEE